MARELTVPEVAAMRGVTAACVYRWLGMGLAFTERFGVKVVREADAKRFQPPPKGRRVGSKNKGEKL